MARSSKPAEPAADCGRVTSHDIDTLIDEIVEHARRWSDDGIDLYPDGIEQFRAGLYPIFGIPPPPGEKRP